MKYLQEHYSNNNYNNFTGSYTQNLFANPTEVSSNAVAIDSLGGINNLAVTQDSNSVNNATGDISEPTNAKKLSALNIGEAIEMAYGKNSKKKADYPLKHKNSGAHGSRNRTTSETVGSNVDNSVNASSGFGELQSRILSKHTFDYNTVNIPESPWGINSASKQSLAPPVAPGSVVGSNVGPINGGLNSAVNSLGNTNFFNESLFNGSLLTNEQFPGKNIPISANNEKDDFIIVDGAVELSAGARPFVPKSLPIRNSAGTIGKSSKTTNSDVLGPNQSLFSSDILSGTNLDLLHPESTTTDSLGISSNAVNKGINHSLNIDGSGLSGLGSLGISENRALLDDLISGSTSGLSHSDLWSSLGSNTSTFGLNSTNWAHANTTGKHIFYFFVCNIVTVTQLLSYS